MKKHKTARGREFNMQAFTASKGETTAVGNSSRNAQGDLLGPGGRIVATSREITNKFYDKKVGAKSTTVSVNPAEKEVSRREVLGIDGIARWEVTFADGSIGIEDKID